MTSRLEIVESSAYEFLAHPPSWRQRFVATAHATETPSTSDIPTAITTVSLNMHGSPSATIIAWAEKVHPGSPAPLTPPSASDQPQLNTHRIARRASYTHLGRRPSDHGISPRIPSASFFGLMGTPVVATTPSIRDCPYDLTALGYKCAVVKLPTPMTPTPKPIAMPSVPTIPPLPIPPASPTLKPCEPSRRCFITRLRLRSRSKSVPASSPAEPTTRVMTNVDAIPPHPSSPSRKPPSPKQPLHRRRSKSVSGKAHASLSKETVYPRRPRAKRCDIPPPLPMENQLALLQFIDGGNREENINQFMQEKATCNGEVAIDAPYRDEEGTVWADAAEKMEYEPLIDEKIRRWDEVGIDEWVDFDATSPAAGSNRTATGRSVTVPSTVDLDLDPRYLMAVDSALDNPVIDVPALLSPHTPTSPPSSTPTICIKPGLSILAVPTRSRRTAPHLNNAPSYIINANAFGTYSPRSPHAARSPRSSQFPRSPRSPRFSPHACGNLTSNARSRPRGKPRKIPAPLKIVPTRLEGTTATSSPLPTQVQPWLMRPVMNAAAIQAARDEFVDGSFRPAPIAGPVGKPMGMVMNEGDKKERKIRGLKGKASKMNPGGGGMRGLFKAVGRGAKEYRTT